ncbi:MAG: ABC transporter ATP-binding protein [Candidatus Eremiobacterales bacterium]
METVVEVERASKRFGATLALDRVDLRLSRGEVVALLGPNGAGKTTLVSLVLGLRKANEGTTRTFGMDPRDRRARSRTGVMLQGSGLPNFLRVGEVVDLFRSYYPHPIERFGALEIAGLADKASAMLVTLSGGQLQRLYFALAICGDPEALFLDEPTVGLDVEARRAFWTHLRAFVAGGRTLLLTTHYLEEADAIADRIVVINAGRIVADASPAALKSSVRNKRVSFETDGSLDVQGLPIVRVISSGPRVDVLTDEPEALLRALFARGSSIRNLEVAGATLEEAVVGLTAGGA